MKKLRMLVLTLVLVLFAGATAQAQVYDFEDMSIGDVIDAIGWGGMVAEVADDPVSSGNNVLKFTPNDYNAAPVLAFTLPEGKTLADYSTFSFKAYFAQGDVGWKDIVVEAYQNMPTAQAFNDETVRIGTVNRASGASSGWEEIAIDIAGSADMTGTVYIAFGINCSGDSDGNTTIWYADDVGLVSGGGSDEAYVVDWGASGYLGWPITKTADTPAGSASMGDGSEVSPSWSSLRGQFSNTLTATTTQAVVVTGKLEYVGGGAGSGYTHLRYALTYQDSVELQNANTDSASWVVTADSSNNALHHGYGFHPRSGLGTMSNGNGGAGTVWQIGGGNWVSTWSNNGVPIAAVKQAPRNAEMAEGIYDFAISVLDLGDGTNELSWYLVAEDNSYWFGGTEIDTAQLSLDFNGIIFGVNNDNEATQFKVSEVKAEMGDPVEVPVAPWEAFYVTEWGSAGYASWPINNDTTSGMFLDGDGSMGDGEITEGWSSLKGGFGDPVELQEGKAFIIRGQLEYDGGGAGSGYTHLRYALTYQDSCEFVNQYTDSAAFAAVEGAGTSHWGYGFHPRSGLGTMSNGNGGAGTLWQIKEGNWVSTWSNNGVPIAAVKQAPRNSEMSEGVYDFAISVQDMGDGTNEVRWYLVAIDNSYWFGGTAIDTAQLSDKFNGIIFGVNNDNEATMFNVYEVQVDMGDPIEVPVAPWQDFYITEWGSAGYASWPINNDTTSGDFLDGDGSMGDGEITEGWSSLKGGFGDPVELQEGKAFIVSGQLEYDGGGAGSGYTHLRYALTYQDSCEFVNQYTDSAAFVAVDSSATHHWGYGFHPRSGLGTMSNGNGGAGTLWQIKEGNWVSTWSNNGVPIAAVKQAPRNAEMAEGVYDFAISVQDLGDGTNEVRWYLVALDNSYWFGGSAIDTAQLSEKFNGIIFGVNNDNEATMFNVYEAKVSMGDPIEVPPAPWQDFYITEWGATSRGSAWPILNDTTSGTFLDGDAAMGDGSIPTDWASIRGGFGDPVELKEGKAMIVSGQLEYAGGGGGSNYTHLRYALYNQDNMELNHQYTDSAMWATTDTIEHGCYGYGFHPRSGLGTMSNGNGGAGTVWQLGGGTGWNSTWSNSGIPMAAVKQAPRNAEMIEGIYDWAISVEPLGDGTNEVRWSLIEINNKYWYGGTVIDTAELSTKFNSVAFSINKDTEVTQFNIFEAKVSMGDPIEVPPAPWEPFYVTEWGFIGGNTGGWNLTPGVFDGDVTVSGENAPTDWAALYGNFGANVIPTTEKALIVTGQMELIGGGFEDVGSLRYGLFYSDSAGSLDSTDVGYAWNGTDDHNSGYLITPPSGSNVASWNGNAGSAGGIIDDQWFNVDGSDNYVIYEELPLPLGAVAGAGIYDFEMSVAPKAEGGNQVNFNLYKDDKSYAFAGSVIDNHSPVASEKFNAIAFAINNSTTTALNLIAVNVDMGDPIEVAVEETNSAQIPTVYALQQNYPNPFNPTTNIRFDLPKDSKVKLAVFDLRGRMVAELVNTNMKAGYHKLNFDASHLSSGLYIYRLQAGDYVSSKKLMLLK